jgi:hypothetical protein
LDYDKKIAQSKNDKSDIFFQKKGTGFYNLYFSDNFNIFAEGLTSCISLEPFIENFHKGPVLNDKVILIENLYNLRKIYNEDYESLKENLKISDDFEFIVYNLSRIQLINDTIRSDRSSAKQILSRDIPITVINKNASYIDLIIRVRAWK